MIGVVVVVAITSLIVYSRISTRKDYEWIARDGLRGAVFQLNQELQQGNSALARSADDLRVWLEDPSGLGIRVLTVLRPRPAGDAAGR